MPSNPAAILRRLKALQARATRLQPELPPVRILRYDAYWRLVDRHSDAIEAMIPSAVEASLAQLLAECEEAGRTPPRPFTIYVGPLGDTCAQHWRSFPLRHDQLIVLRLLLENPTISPGSRIRAERVPDGILMPFLGLLADDSETAEERAYWAAQSAPCEHEYRQSQREGQSDESSSIFWPGRFDDCPDCYRHLRTHPRVPDTSQERERADDAP